MTDGIFHRAYLEPYVIAEIGVNHEGSMARAERMIEAAANAGAHAAKFQTYKAETLASRAHSPAYWDVEEEPTRSQFELFSRHGTFGPRHYNSLAKTCSDHGIDFLSTPFDADAVAMLTPLVPAFKIASADATNLPLLRRVASAGKPVILSTGACDLAEIAVALDELETAGARDICLMHCVLRYPTPPALANLSVIPTLIQAFGDRAAIGYSDHVPPAADGTSPALEFAATLGARVLEKHFTDDRRSPGNDHYHALDEFGLTELTAKLASLKTLAGASIPDLLSQESAILNARRRIFLAAPVDAGDVVTEELLIPLRADVGIEVAAWDSVLGRTFRVAKEVGEPLERADLSPTLAQRDPWRERRYL